MTDQSISPIENAPEADDRLKARVAELEAQIAAANARAEAAEGDVDELAFCEGCGGSCTKMPENNCYPPRWCHRCYQELMKQLATLRAQAERDAAVLEAARNLCAYARETLCVWGGVHSSHAIAGAREMFPKLEEYVVTTEAAVRARREG